MTTMSTEPLSGTLGTLVDARLDTIDRMLLGRVPRSDRLAIVREVESQIHDLLGERDAGSLDRDEVLAVLARLDPPEAYLPDEATGEPGPARHPSIPRGPRPSRDVDVRVARASGILGLVSLTMAFVSALIAFFGSGALALLVFFGSIGLTFVTGLLALVLAAYARLRGPWAIVGLVNGILSVLAVLLGIGVELMG